MARKQKNNMESACTTRKVHPVKRKTRNILRRGFYDTDGYHRVDDNQIYEVGKKPVQGCHFNVGKDNVKK